MNKKILKIVVPIILIAAGIIIMKLLISTRPAPSRENGTKDPGILVEVIKAKKQDTEVVINGTGTVKSAREISVIPQVSGLIVYTAPNLVVGGFFKKDDVLFEIEDTDYRLALERAMSSRAKAEYELATIESQAQIARLEWEMLNRNSEIPANPLALYEPQLKNAKAAFASASAQVKQAGLNLNRTKIRAPFNARVRSENIDQGQFVRAGNSVAVLSGTDTAEIAVPLSLDKLRWLQVPRHGESQKGAKASVNVHIGGKEYKWHGHITRSTGEVDPKTRMIKLIIEIQDPYGLNAATHTLPALATGTFVDVHIKGRKLKDVFMIPRSAFRDNSTVWVMDGSDRLIIKKVVPLKIDRDRVIISKGIDDGEMIVMTNISGAADGMKLRPIKQ